MRQHPGKRNAAGFTLLELLVAMAIFSFLSTAMFTGIRQIVLEREVLLEQMDSLKRLQRAVRSLFRHCRCTLRRSRR